eukprot:scaffold13836_cov66-Skeletonema_marinoi.AAC.2
MRFVIYDILDSVLNGVIGILVAGRPISGSEKKRRPLPMGTLLRVEECAGRELIHDHEETHGFGELASLHLLLLLVSVCSA